MKICSPASSRRTPWTHNQYININSINEVGHVKKYYISPNCALQVTSQLVSKMADIDKWIDIAKECKYLPENDLKVISSLCWNIYHF
jgi:hypothetical protein